MISPQYVDGLELRIEELASELRSHKAALAGLSDTTLARLKAEWQAEAVSAFAFHYLGGHEQELAEIYAGKLRRQAEGETE